MLPEGFEPPITVPKTVVISVSLREHRWLSYFFFCYADMGISRASPPVPNGTFGRVASPSLNTLSGNRSSARPVTVVTRLRLTTLASSRLLAGPATLTFDSPSPLQKHSRPTRRVVLVVFVRIRGIEPRSPPWQGGVLPLNHIRAIKRADYTAPRLSGNATSLSFVPPSSPRIYSPQLACCSTAWRQEEGLSLRPDFALCMPPGVTQSR